MVSTIRTGFHLRPHLFLISTLPSCFTPPKLSNHSKLWDIYFLIERKGYGVPAYLYVYPLSLLGTLTTTTITLTLAHINI